MSRSAAPAARAVPHFGAGRHATTVADLTRALAVEHDPED